MRPEPTDNRSTPVQEGQRVAFNLSGQVALGEVLAVVPGTRYGRPVHTIHVELLHEAAGMFTGHISKIRDPLNLLVLKPGDAT